EFRRVLFRSPLVSRDERLLLARAARRVALAGEAVELFGVHVVGEFRVELIVAVAVEQEVLLQGLVAVQRLAYVRDGRVEVLLDGAEVRLAPEGVNDRVLRDAAVATRRDEAEYVARAPRHPRVGRERARGVAEDFDSAEHVYRQVCRRPLGDDEGRARRRERNLRRGGRGLKLFAQVSRQKFGGLRRGEDLRELRCKTLEP